MNNVSLIGRITKDIELRKSTSGKSVTSFTLAVQRDKENADFINCVAWNGTADLLCRYAKKGHRIGLNGRIQTRKYEDNTGHKVYITEVIANSIELLEKKETNNQDGQNNGYRSDVQSAYERDFGSDTLDIATDDLPF